MERKCTNLSSLVVCCGFVVLLLILVGYSGTKSDLNLLTKGSDNCGNVCGRKNVEHLNIPSCKALDMTFKPLLKIDFINQKLANYTCVEACPQGYTEIFKRCFSTGANEVSQDLIKLWPKIILICFVAAIFSYILLILFRYAIEYIIWVVYILCVVALGVGSILFGIFYAKQRETALLVTSIVFGIAMILDIVMLIWFRKRIKLVAQLFKEASKALIDVTSILFEPILTFISLLLAIALFVFFMIVIETAGDFVKVTKPDRSSQVVFQQGSAIVFAKVLNYIAFIWFTQFIFGCQHFVIGGTISKWYFARDKSKLDSPVWTTFNHLVRFHLGSVCLGSIFITLVKILRMIADALRDHAIEERNLIIACIACFIVYLLELAETFLKYLIRNAYIIVAKDGTPLIESGRKAFDLIFENLMDVVALNKFGDLVLVMARLFVFAISTLIAYYIMNIPGINYLWIPVLLSAIFSFLIAHCFIAVFEMTVDTIFICFCDDLRENDGNSKLYFMSPQLKIVMEKLKEESGGSFNFGRI